MRDMLDEGTNITISEIKEVKVFRKLVPGVLVHLDSTKILKDITYMDLETFLYTNSLNVDTELFKKKVNELSEKHNIEKTSFSDESINLYPIFLLKYVYTHMKDFEKENK